MSAPKKLFILTFFYSALFFFTISAQTPKILWWFDTNDSSFGVSAMDDIDQDGKYEIVFGCYRNDSMVYALNAEDGSLLWKYNTSIGLGACNDAAPLIYDVTGSAQKEVIVASSCTPITFCLNGSNGNVIWQTPSKGSDSPPVIADLNKDGNLEILHGEFAGYVINIDALTGAQNWEILVDPNSWVQTAPTIVDVDGNDTLDFVVATWGFSNNSALYAYHGATQNLLWSIPMAGYVYHGTAVADLDNDSKPELVIGDYSGKLHVVNAEDGSYLWMYQGPGYIGGPATIGDFTGDGICDVVFASGSRIIALSNAGSLLWQFIIPGGGQAFRGVVLADITNDSVPEIIFSTSNKGMVYALNGTSGTPLWNLDLQAHMGMTFEIDHAPVIADFDGDDTLDLFVVGGYTQYPNIQNNYGRGYAIQIGKGKGPEWKMFQHDYYRTSSMCYPGSILNNSHQSASLFAVSVFPNPVQKNAMLQIANLPASRNFSVQLMDMFGKKIFEGQNIRSIEMNSLKPAAGIYLLRIVEQGNRLKQFKVAVAD